MKHRLEFRDKFIETPITFWVHKMPGDPELPKAIPLKGYPYLIVNALGVELEFASTHEAEHFLKIISQKNLQTTLSLSEQRGTSVGPNGHWLSRLPSKLKSWSNRQKIIPSLRKGIIEYKKIEVA